MKLLMAALLAAAGSANAAPAKLVLTVDGIGPVRIGMTMAAVEKVIGGKLEGQAIESDDICVEKVSKAGPEYLVYMFEDGKLTRISLGEDSKFRTPRGIGIGSKATDVRRAYGPKLVAEPHTYEEPPGEFLTYWTVLNKRGISFETDKTRTVRVIHAGTNSIQYIEGCA